MNAAAINIGDTVTARYYSETVSGTVSRRRWHTLRHGLLELTIEFPPTAVLGSTRTALILSVDSSGNPVSGWNDCQILTINS